MATMIPSSSNTEIVGAVVLTTGQSKNQPRTEYIAKPSMCGDRVNPGPIRPTGRSTWRLFGKVRLPVVVTWISMINELFDLTNAALPEMSA